ncbi:hypothetical protein ETU10_11035 [Apibacter muscae]|uniref:hypothetical protein n=1 Tax=Apibacter muscae TaxID=2509004 RepID=UPI0011AD0D9E|nr:hypothetical protein [Apibacter muscae]TWP22474.1 hypothetical protein ETU10_11035 [Apibacter muscae]
MKIINKKKKYFKIKNIILFSLLIFTINCKGNKCQEREHFFTKKETSDSINNWKFCGVETFNSDIDDSISIKMRNLKLHMTKDTLFINNKYKNKINIQKMEAHKFFRSQYIYDYYTSFLKNKYKINARDTVQYIELDYNKNGYPKEYLKDGLVAIFMNNHIFLEYSGYIFCYTKPESKDNVKSFPVTSESIKNKLYNIYSYDKKYLNPDYTCGEDYVKGYYLGKNNNNYEVYIVENSCGDFYFLDLLVIKNNTIISKITIDNDSWDVEQSEVNNIKNEIVTTFKIDTNYTIFIKTKKILNKKTQSEEEKEYEINNQGKIIRIKK